MAAQVRQEVGGGLEEPGSGVRGSRHGGERLACRLLARCGRRALPARLLRPLPDGGRLVAGDRAGDDAAGGRADAFPPQIAVGLQLRQRGSAAAIRVAPSGKRAARVLMSAGAPFGRDWRWVPSPMARSESSGCWARWLPITTKRVVCRVLSCWRPPVRWVRFGCLSPATRTWARGGALGFWGTHREAPPSSVVRPSHWDCRPGGGGVSCLRLWWGVVRCPALSVGPGRRGNPASSTRFTRPSERDRVREGWGLAGYFSPRVFRSFSRRRHRSAKFRVPVPV